MMRNGGPKRALAGPRRSLGWWLILCLPVLLCSREARAQIAEAAYSDAKDVIAELITAEVSQAAVPGIACYSGRRDSTHATAVAIDEQAAGAPPVKRYRFEAPRHFPRTLQRIFNRQYGSLRTTVRDESASLAAYLVFRGLLAANAQATNKAVPLAALKQQLSKALNTAPVAAPAPGGIDFRPLSGAQYAECIENTRQIFDANLLGHQATYALDEECAASRALRKSTFDGYECNVAFGVREALVEDFVAAQDYLVKAVAGILLDNAGLLANDAAFDATVALLRDVLANPNWDAARFATAVAKLGTLNAELLALADLQLAAFINGLPPALNAPVAAAVATAPSNVLAKLAAVRAALAALPGAPALEELNKLLELERFATMASQALAPLLAELTRLPRLHAAWRAAISRRDGVLTIAEFIDIAKHASSGLCSAGVSGSCKALAGLTGTSQLLDPFVQLASNGQYRELAHLVVRYVFQQKADDEAEEATSVYQRFAESVVMYVLDVSDERVPSQATRAAFRAAAVDLLRELGRAGGVKRRAWSVPHWWFFRYPEPKPIFLPDFALRLSWSPSFVNEADGPSRVVASIDWLALRMPIKRGNIGYFGLQASLFDPLAPLSELSLRRTTQTEYRQLSRLAWNMITPRIEAVAALPALSEHLAITGGISLRLTAPLKNRTESSETETVYDYRWFNDSDDAAGESQWPRFLEFGVAVKYVL